jgi:hypothetical protein
MNTRIITDTAYTFKMGDVGHYLEFTNASPITATVPGGNTGSTPRPDKQDWSDGEVLTFIQGGAGALTIAAGRGVTIRTPETLVLARQYASASLVYRGNDLWDLAGYMTSA